MNGTNSYNALRTTHPIISPPSPHFPPPSSPHLPSSQSLFPGLNASTPASVTFGVRCWTHWNRGLNAGIITITPAAALPAAYLGGVQISGRNSTIPFPLAPSKTQLLTAATGVEPFHQLLVVDWFNVSATTVLQVSEKGGVVPINLIEMKLPITGLANANGNDMVRGYLGDACLRDAWKGVSGKMPGGVPRVRLERCLEGA